MKRVRKQTHTLHNQRQFKVRRRKATIPLFVATTLLWVTVTVYVVTVSPDRLGAIPFFFVLLFATLLTTSLFFVGHFRRSFLISCVIAVFAILIYFGIGTILNAVLLVTAAISFEIYFTKTLD